MKLMLDWQNIYRQGTHQNVANIHTRDRDLLQTSEQVSQVRADHPEISFRDIYSHYLIKYSEGVISLFYSKVNIIIVEQWRPKLVEYQLYI